MVMEYSSRFVYAIQRLANPDTAAPYSYLLAGFENAEGVLNGIKRLKN